MATSVAILFFYPQMPTLVFDIETSGLPPEAFDEVQQEYLFREAEQIGKAGQIAPLGPVLAKMTATFDRVRTLVLNSRDNLPLT